MARGLSPLAGTPRSEVCATRRSAGAGRALCRGRSGVQRHVDPRLNLGRGEFVGVAVMEKRAGWGTEYPENIRNGEWEYQAFKPDKAVNTAANLTNCFTCHKPLDKQDYVFSYDRMKAAAK